MRAWVPVPGSTRARLLDGALTEFGARGYGPVAVQELAARAGVTIGSLYHHFHSKAGLYDVVRTDVERRVLDRMEGAAAAGAGVPTMLLVGFDYLTRTGYARLVAEPHPARADDPVARMIEAQADHDGQPVGRLVLAAWREALSATADIDPGLVRAALTTLLR